MRIVIALRFASCCFGQGQRSAAAAGKVGDPALKRKAAPHTCGSTSSCGIAAHALVAPVRTAVVCTPTALTCPVDFTVDQ
jgi:hypothetical protein